MNALVCAATSSADARACAEALREQGMAVTACDPREVASELERLDGGVDVLVTVSDMRSEGSIEGTSDASFCELIDVNLTAVFKAARECFAAMRANAGGVMIHVASDAGIRAEHEAAAYSVACAGVIALSELFAAEGAPHGIRANAVCPASSTDVASIVTWLASEQSAHVNGATIRVDDAAGAAMAVDTRV
jgi:NAD(P)-dependent dehydrogenase (short-subunit alcohol dehydrogenase family)